VIRIVLAEVPRLLADIIKSEISPRSDMAIVKEVHGGQNLDAVVTEADAHVVVASLSSPIVPRDYQRLLFGSRSVALVTISADGRDAQVYTRKVIREVSVDQIVQAIGAVAATGVPEVSDKLM